MKLLIIVVGLATAVAARAPITLDYHEEIGIPAAARIKRAEEAKDFDGARIVGGQASALGEHPHVGGLIIEGVNGGFSMCGSSLLSYTRLVTGAHCWRTRFFQARQFTVVLGSTNLYTGGVRIVTTDVEMHPNYNVFDFSNDIAMIRIPHVPYTHVVLRILLPTGNNDYIGSWATTVGYGSFDGSHIVTNEIQRHSNLQVVPNSACEEIFGSLIIDSSLCASTTPTSSPCWGDSGGPLSIGSGSTRELIGVSSFGLSLCNRGFPVVYTRVTTYASWIRARL